MSNSESGGSFGLGLLIGGIIGALVGLLLAPKAGSETRSELWARSEVLRSRADEAAASLREQVRPATSGLSSRIGPTVESVRDRGGAMAGTVRDASVNAFDAARATGSAAIDGMAHRIGKVNEEPEAADKDSEAPPIEASKENPSAQRSDE